MATKYKVLAEVLRNSIGKELLPGDKLPTQKELMKRHGVSLATVERALRILSDEQLIACHVGRGTFVNDAVTAKKTGNSGSICMVSTLSGQDIASNWHQGPIFAGIRSVLEEAGLRFMLSDYGSIEDISHFSGFAGLIFMAPKEDEKKFVKKYQSTGMPSVIISASWQDVDMPSVDCDNEYGIRCALRYLADRGHARIGYVDQTFRSFDALARRAAFENMSGEFGVKAADYITVGYDYLDDEMLCGLREMFASEDRPTALIFSSLFPVTMQVVAELRGMGLSVPQDVSIIGFDDSSWAKCMDPALTVIRQPLSTMGRHAAERLIEQMNGKACIKSEVLPIELIERGSVATAGSLAKVCVASAR
jgi:DNA-binding LacI/PurR family transcriptional regulator